MTSRRQDSSKQLGRRQFLKLSGTSALAAATAATAVVSATGSASAAISGRTNRPADLPKATGPRCVIVGGGASGLTLAKYLKKENPKFDVVMVEPNYLYMSPFLSAICGSTTSSTLNSLQHSFCDAARKGNYFWLQGMLIDLDREKKRAYTSEGYIDYQFIALAPGIDYNYASIGITDPALAVYCSRIIRPASSRARKTSRSKTSSADFERGVFLITVPTGNYRCLPAPYERACLIGDYFKKNKIKGKIVLLDPGEKPFAPKAPGFLAAFRELYKDYIDYKPSTTIKSVDPIKKTVTTEFDTISFDDAAIYPRVRGAKLIEDLGLADTKSPQLEADIDLYKYFCKGDKTCYVTGDCTADAFLQVGQHRQQRGAFVAKVIAAAEAGKDIDWMSPQTVCYSMVNAHPEESIMVAAKYDKKTFGFTDVQLDNKRSAALGKANHEWGAGLYRDMF